MFQSYHVESMTIILPRRAYKQLHTPGLPEKPRIPQHLQFDTTQEAHHGGQQFRTSARFIEPYTCILRMSPFVIVY
jgi:hypothetical protein